MSVSLIRRGLLRTAKRLDAYSNSDVREAQKILARGENSDIGGMRQARDESFARLVRHCYAHVPYYRRMMDDRGISPHDIVSLDDLGQFPVLTKDDVATAGEALLATNIRSRARSMRQSGGTTTGEPLAAYIDRRGRAIETYALLRGHSWMGWRPGMSKVTLFGGSLGRTGRAPFRSRLRDAVLGYVFISAFSITRETVARDVATISRAGRCVLNGYASALLRLALLIQDNAVRASMDVAAVFSTSEVMPQDWAETIGRVFQAPVLSYYGCCEVNSIGFQVEPGGPYVVPDEHVALELLDPAADASPAPRPLLITALYNYAQPRIRYMNGDLATLSAPGQDHPTRTCIRELPGRMGDVIVGSEGIRLSAMLGSVVKQLCLPIRRYQIIQHAVDHLEIRYEPNSSDVPAEALDPMIRLFQERLGVAVRVELCRTDQFVLSAAGKHRIVIVDPSVSQREGAAE